MNEQQNIKNLIKRIKIRAVVICITMAVFVSAVVFKIGYVQIVQADWLIEQAAQVWSKNSKLIPNRGMILDRNGERLAYNAKAYTIIAHPRLITDPINTSRKLAGIINMSEQRIYELITRDAYQVELGPGGRKVSEDVLMSIKELELVGISSKEEKIRFYPNYNFASHVLGFINATEQGVTGIEQIFNNELKGTEGKISYITDGRRREIPAGVKSFEPAENGMDIVLTIDQNIQHFVERAIDDAMEIHKPNNIGVIVANPQNGEILALANRPNFNLNNITKQDSNNIYQNFTLSQFEPGSTFKLFTLAAALEENILTLEDRIVDNGKISVPGGTIHTWNRIGYGEISIAEALQKSSNVAFVEIGLNKLGEKKLFEYIEKFGFGSKTEIELPNEMKGDIFSNRKRYPIEIATTSFGQGISVTPIQQIRAVSAIANGGYLIKPTIIKEIKRNDSVENIINDTNEMLDSNKILSDRTTLIMKEAMESVVNVGSGSNGKVDGYRVAGKTGTAQKVDKTTGTYSTTKYIASYIGFAPVEDPQVIIYVAVDEPSTKDIYGSTVSAPIFKDIMQDTLKYLGIKSNNEKNITQTNNTEVKNFIGKFVTESITIAENSGLKVKIIGDGNYIVKQSIQELELVPQGTTVMLLTGTEDGQSSIKTIPDLLEKSKREVLEILSFLEIDYVVEGEGFVVEQSIVPNTTYNNTPLLLKFSPYSTTVLNEPPIE